MSSNSRNKPFKLSTKAYLSLTPKQKSELRSMMPHVYNDAKREANRRLSKRTSQIKRSPKIPVTKRQWNSDWYWRNNGNNSGYVFTPCETPKQSRLSKRKIIECLRLQGSNNTFGDLTDRPWGNFLSTIGLNPSDQMIENRLNITKRQKLEMLKVLGTDQLATILNFVQYGGRNNMLNK